MDKQKHYFTGELQCVFKEIDIIDTANRPMIFIMGTFTDRFSDTEIINTYKVKVPPKLQESVDELSLKPGDEIKCTVFLKGPHVTARDSGRSFLVTNIILGSISVVSRISDLSESQVNDTIEEEASADVPF